MKTYVATWDGQLLLACGKCQRKLRRGDDEYGLGKLKKMLRKRRKSGDTPIQFLVINTPCFDVCPKAGVVVCTQAHIGEGLFSILRDTADVDALLLSSEVAQNRK